MSNRLVALIAELVIIVIVFQALLSLLKTVFSTALAIVIIGIVLTFFGFSPQELIQRIINLPETLQELLVQLKKIFGF
jgi:ABC-type microcin C transport system permease subunit YejE